MKILIVAATPFEIGPLQEFLKKNTIQYQKVAYQKGEYSFEILISGVGIPATVFSLSRKLIGSKIDLVINAGIAGAFKHTIELGSVWQIVQDCFADLGIEEADESFKDLFEIELLDPNSPPFRAGQLINEDASAFEFLPSAKALTVSKVSGSQKSIDRLMSKYNADLESMEGAACFYVCQQLNIKVLQIRSVSNYIEPRNRENWELGLAIENLNHTLIQLISTFIK